MARYIVGLGCSWTQGEGGYPEQVWKAHGGRVQVRGLDDFYLRHIEHENSWVNVLCRDHFTDHTPINLGVRGIGNYAAVHQLHFCDKIDWEKDEGIIVFMLSGFERLDLFQQHPHGSDGHDDGYSINEYRHYKWRTAWPFATNDMFWKTYAKELWADQFVSSWQMMALLDVQTFAKAHGFKLVIGNGFNQVENGDIYTHLKKHSGYLVDKFDWSNYAHTYLPYRAFIQKLVQLDGLMRPEDWHSYHNFYHQRDWPAEYLTNCEGAHPTLKGYKVIADELASFIKYKEYV
jgi:hypothetical protein